MSSGILDMLLAFGIIRECLFAVRAIVARLPGVSGGIGMLLTCPPPRDFLLALEAPDLDRHPEGRREQAVEQV